MNSVTNSWKLFGCRCWRARSRVTQRSHAFRFSDLRMIKSRLIRTGHMYEGVKMSFLLRLLKASKTFTMQTSMDKNTCKWVDERRSFLERRFRPWGIRPWDPGRGPRSPFGDWCPPPQKHEQVDSSDPLSFVQKI